MIGADVTPDWLDHVAVNRAVAGVPVGRPLHRAERTEVARRLVAAGRGTTAIARATGCSRRDAIQLAETVQP